MILYYVIGAITGGLFGYFVLYKLIGCATGSCPMTANPYISTILGIVSGLLVTGIIISSVNTEDAEETPSTPAIAYMKITAEDAKSRIDSEQEIILLDVRTEAEYNVGHIPNAILIPNETITDEMPALLPDLDAEILIYCRSGNRSAQAAKKLIAIGYTNVYDFGGINDWPYDIVTEP
ncbi:MAG: rhodanese-like domain-containing protein [Christensenellales bacterium]|jgi:phage shock protein E